MPSTVQTSNSQKSQPKRTMSLQNVVPSGNFPPQYNPPVPTRRTSIPVQTGQLHPSTSAPQINNAVYNPQFPQQQQQYDVTPFQQQMNSYEQPMGEGHVNDAPKFQLAPHEVQANSYGGQGDAAGGLAGGSTGAGGHFESQNQHASPEQPLKTRQRWEKFLFVFLCVFLSRTRFVLAKLPSMS